MNTLALQLPPPTVNNLRCGKGSVTGSQRLVLDLNGPALLQRSNGDLRLELKVSPTEQRQLKALAARSLRSSAAWRPGH